MIVCCLRVLSQSHSLRYLSLRCPPSLVSPVSCRYRYRPFFGMSQGSWLIFLGDCTVQRACALYTCSSRALDGHRWAVLIPVRGVRTWSSVPCCEHLYSPFKDLSLLFSSCGRCGVMGPALMSAAVASAPFDAFSELLVLQGMWCYWTRIGF